MDDDTTLIPLEADAVEPGESPTEIAVLATASAGLVALIAALALGILIG